MPGPGNSWTGSLRWSGSEPSPKIQTYPAALPVVLFVNRTFALVGSASADVSNCATTPVSGRHRRYTISPAAASSTTAATGMIQTGNLVGGGASLASKATTGPSE